MQTQKARLTFTPGALPLILKAFGKKIDQENGVIRDIETNEPIMTPEGEEITKSTFGGIKKGSTLFLKKDLLTAIKLVEHKY